MHYTHCTCDGLDGHCIYYIRGYDIRIGDNCGPLVPVTRDSLSYRLAEDLTASMKRKRYTIHCSYVSRLLFMVPMIGKIKAS